MIIFTIPIAIVIGILISRKYAPKTKSEKIWASILIPLISGVFINFLVASYKNSGFGFMFDVGLTLLFVAIPEVALLITLFASLEVGGKKNWNDTSTIKLHYGVGENRVDFEVSLTQKEILQMAKLREQDPERWKDNELELVKMVKKEMTVIQLEKEKHMDKQGETIDENVEKVEESIESQITNNESDRKEKIVEKTKTEEKDNEADSGVKTNKKKHDNKLSKCLKLLLIAILSLGLLFGLGMIISFVYTKYIYPSHAKAEDEKMLESAKRDPSIGYKVAQELYKREKDGHKSRYKDFITNQHGECHFDHEKAGKEATEIFCRYIVDYSKDNIDEIDEIARQLFLKHDGHCDELYFKTGVELLKYGAEKGNADAQFTLGCYYGGAEYDKVDGEWNSYLTLDGHSVDNAKRAYWYLQAANQGHTMAMGNLGNCYMYGVGVVKDVKKGLELTQRAAELGDEFYQCRLGDYYSEGVQMEIGSHKEKRKTTDYRSDQIRNYYDERIHDIIYVYEVDVIDYKTILPKDMKQAQYWWKKAANNGDETAKERLQKIYE